MLYLLPNMATGEFNDISLILKDRNLNPILLKEVNSPISISENSAVIKYINQLVTGSEYLAYYTNDTVVPHIPYVIDNLTDEDLTKIGMLMASKSLEENWNNKEDEHWEIFS